MKAMKIVTNLIDTEMATHYALLLIDRYLKSTKKYFKSNSPDFNGIFVTQLNPPAKVSLEACIDFVHAT